MSNLQDKINELEIEIKAIKKLRDYIYQKNVSLPAESNQFPFYQDLAKKEDIQQLSKILDRLQEELVLIRKENLLLQERQPGMFNTYDYYIDY
jgi:hypothetical protein